MSALLALLLALATDDSKFLIQEPLAAQRVDYLILAGDPFANRLEELASYRKKQGYAVGIIAVSSLKGQLIRDFLAHAVEKWTRPAPTYLLLVGDVDTVPTVNRPHDSPAWEPDLATDFEYACPNRELDPILHVGRFPCDTVEELQLMIRKTLDYETNLPSGPWQKRVSFLAGTAGFSKEADAAIEKLFAQIVGGTIPSYYDVEVAYANPRSPYCPFPPSFNDNGIRLLNEGSLLYVFVGHGSRDSVASFQWEGKTYEVLEDDHATKIDVHAGLPVMVVIACSTGEIDSKEDCLGESCFKVAKGPVAFLGGSRITHPYGNSLLGKELALHLLGDSKTLGEGLTRVKRAILAHEADKLTKQIDFMSAMMGIKKEGMEAIRKDVVRHYNLLGDPALMLRRPAPSIQITFENGIVTVEGTVGEVTLTLECAREKLAKPAPKIDRKDPDYETKVNQRYRDANNKVLQTWNVKLSDGKGREEIELPKEPGTYHLKASSGEIVGSLEVKVELPKGP